MLALSRLFLSGATEVHAHCLIGNDRSARLLAWLGFLPCGRTVLRSRPLRAEDQSAVNIACAGRILPLPPEFNVFTDPAAWTPATLPARLVVAHYVVNQKPWRAHAKMGGIWHVHADRIAAFMPPLPPVSLKSRLSALNRNRRIALGLLTGRKKYRDRLAVAALMERRFVRPYLAAERPPKVSGR